MGVGQPGAAKCSRHASPFRRDHAVIEIRASDAGRIFTLHVELAYKMRQAFYDNSSTQWKQSILAMLKQTPIWLPVGAPTGRQCKGALPDVRNAGAGRRLDRRRRRDRELLPACRALLSSDEGQNGVGNPSANKRSRQSAHLSIFRGYLRPYAAANPQISRKTVR
jgi:hypothetical protein